MSGKMNLESVMDTPREGGLCGDLWTFDPESGKYVLAEDAERKVMTVFGWMSERFGMEGRCGMNIVGSMTSNQYSDDSDIDLHFNCESVGDIDADEFNREFRSEFENVFMPNFQDVCMIGNHPIEVYFQKNPLQDLMSVGCYDVLGKRWLVGPEFADADFDPYEEYYSDCMDLLHGVIGDVRSVILECYESAVAIGSSSSDDFREFEFRHLRDALSRAAGIFSEAREYRKVSSSPQSPSKAEELRNSREWKVADSAFKMLDRFGYLGILRVFAQCHEKIVEGRVDRDLVVREILDSVGENLSKNANLDENERILFEDLQEESLGDVVRYAMLMGALSSPMIDAEGGQEAAQERIPQRHLQTLKTKVGDLEYFQVQNLVAWTIWTEARGEYRKHGLKALNAVASVIWNRANRDPRNLPDVIRTPKQFSWWNGYDGGFGERTYVPQKPSEEELKNPSNSEIWKICNRIANDMIEGKFVSTIGNRNMIANRGKDNSAAWNSWGRNADLKIGSHTFGYERYWDGAYRYGDGRRTVDGGRGRERVHTVVRGDTIGKIARDNNTTVEEIMRKNPEIENANSIRIGQRIRI